MPNDLTKKVSREIHKFVLEELDEQQRMLEKKPRLEAYPDHLNNAADAIIAAIRECDAEPSEPYRENDTIRNAR